MTRSPSYDKYTIDPCPIPSDVIRVCGFDMSVNREISVEVLARSKDWFVDKNWL